ncbi:MAG: hypothetical protein QM572_07320 [Nocardioides sp.]|uniref:hypothetical protein n=1 Tax=Nocardioides sp. TaxID=35761 RepID=UPI0039E2C8E8
MTEEQADAHRVQPKEAAAVASAITKLSSKVLATPRYRYKETEPLPEELQQLLERVGRDTLPEGRYDAFIKLLQVACGGQVSKDYRRRKLPIVYRGRRHDHDEVHRLRLSYIAERMLPGLTAGPFPDTDSTGAEKLRTRRTTGYDLVCRDLANETDNLLSLAGEIADAMRLELASALLRYVQRREKPRPPVPAVASTHVLRPDLESELTAALKAEAGLIWVTGDVGTGKSYLVNHVLEQAAVRAVFIRCDNESAFIRDTELLVAAESSAMAPPVHPALLVARLAEVLIAGTGPELVVFDGYDQDTTATAGLFEGAVDFLTPIIVISRHPQPTFESFEPWSQPITVGDFDLSMSGEFIWRRLPQATVDQSKRLGTALFGRALAMSNACALIRSSELAADIQALCDDLDLDQYAADFRKSSGTAAIGNIYRKSLERIGASAYGDHARLILESLTASADLTLPALVLESLIRHTDTKSAAHRSLPGRTSPFVDLFRERGVADVLRHGEPGIRPVLRLGVEGAIRELIDANFAILQADGSVIMKPFTALILVEIFGDSEVRSVCERLVTTAAAELACWHWFAGYLLPPVMVSWAGVLRTEVIQSMVLRGDADSNSAGLIAAAVMRVRIQCGDHRAIAAHVPTDDAGKEEIYNVLNGKKLRIDDYDYTMCAELIIADTWHPERRRPAAQLTTELIHRQVLDPGTILTSVVPHLYSNMAVSANRPTLESVVIGAQRLVWAKHEIDSYEPNMRLEIGRWKYAGGLAASWLGNFEQSTALFRDACRAFRSVGALESVAGEIRAAANGLMAAMHAYDGNSMVEFDSLMRETFDWARDGLPAAGAEYGIIDFSTAAVYSDASAEKWLQYATGLAAVTPPEDTRYVINLREEVKVSLIRVRALVGQERSDALGECYERILRLIAFTIWQARQLRKYYEDLPKKQDSIDLNWISDYIPDVDSRAMNDLLGLKFVNSFGQRKVRLAGLVFSSLSFMDGRSHSLDEFFVEVVDPVRKLFAAEFGDDVVVDLELVGTVYPHWSTAWRLAETFRDEDAAAYWSDRAAAIAVCLSEMNKEAPTIPDDVREYALKAARRRGRTDWVYAMTTGLQQADCGLLRFCAI